MNAQVGGQPKDPTMANNLTQGLIGSINAINVKQLTPYKVREYAEGYKTQNADQYYNNNQITKEQYDRILAAIDAKIEEAETEGMGTGTGTRVQDTAPTARKSKYPYINPRFQTMLGVNPDGQLGDITQAALERYKVSVGNPGISNDLAYEYLKRETEYATGSEMVYDDNSDTYVTNKQKQQAAPGLVREVPF